MVSLKLLTHSFQISVQIFAAPITNAETSKARPLQVHVVAPHAPGNPTLRLGLTTNYPVSPERFRSFVVELYIHPHHRLIHSFQEMGYPAVDPNWFESCYCLQSTGQRRSSPHGPSLPNSMPTRTNIRGNCIYGPAQCAW